MKRKSKKVEPVVERSELEIAIAELSEARIALAEG